MVQDAVSRDKIRVRQKLRVVLEQEKRRKGSRERIYTTGRT